MEADSQVKTSRLSEFMHKKMEIMELKVPGWKVPMEAGISVGRSWGEMFDFRWDSETKEWVPKHEPYPYEPLAPKKEEDDETVPVDPYDLFSELDDDEIDDEDIY